MRILINSSNLIMGGAIQVANSIFHELYKFTQHSFIVVYSDALATSAESIKDFKNVECIIHYQLHKSAYLVLTGKDNVLDRIVKEKKVEGVVTIFGPSRWRPSISHVSGFAIPHLVIPESPYFKTLGIKDQIKMWLYRFENTYSVDKSSNYYYTENPFITQRLKARFPKKEVVTITNNVNQIFFNPSEWDRSIVLPEFKGNTFLTISANYPHKNLKLVVPTIDYLCENYKEFDFRFVLTIKETDFPHLSKRQKEHILFIGPVRIEQCPYLYEQSDIMVLPSLLECFSASYAEAMTMRKPIITTDLNFARGLCGESAVYFSPVSPRSLGDALFDVSTNSELKKKLVSAGEKQITIFDTFDKRAEKIIDYLINVDKA